MLKQLAQFLTRWAANCLGLAAAVALNILSISGGARYLVVSGLLLALLNAVIKPILIIVSLPLIALTLGFFLIIINGLVVYVLSIMYPPMEIQNLWFAMVAGIIVGLVNYIVTIVYERFTTNE
jgi:putative membrane protein